MLEATVVLGRFPRRSNKAVISLGEPLPALGGVLSMSLFASSGPALPGMFAPGYFFLCSLMLSDALAVVFPSLLFKSITLKCLHTTLRNLRMCFLQRNFVSSSFSASGMEHCLVIS